jgi:hypothetical protein
MTKTINQSTYDIEESVLNQMPLTLNQLPTPISEFSLLRESILTNETMVKHGFPGKTESDYKRIGRLIGYLREFASPSAIPQTNEGADVVAATVVHLFEDEQGPEKWMNEIFVQQFMDNIGKNIGETQKLISVEKLIFNSFYNEAVGIRAIQDGEEGILSTTVIDFRIGRILGVSFVVTIGDCYRTKLSTILGLELEKNIIRKILDTR